jgi:hypothetical protein
MRGSNEALLKGSGGTKGCAPRPPTRHRVMIGLPDIGMEAKTQDQMFSPVKIVKFTCKG